MEAVDLMIRSFIAVDLPANVHQALAVLQQELQRVGAPVSWVKPDKIHLTLKFLGDISPERVTAIQAILHSIAAGTAPFRLQPLGCGAFPSLKQMRVVWVGLQGASEPLLNLQQAIEQALVPLGFAVEDRPFRAHLTLGRVRGRGHLYQLQQALLQRQSFQAEAFDVPDVVLYKSELRPEGARYTPLLRAVFSGSSRS
jgi:RNA 2',3'-cyclic 3'-phosphodiesterase